MNAGGLHSGRILVVDDEEAILDEFRAILCASADQDGAEYKLNELSAELFKKSCPRFRDASFEVVLCEQGEEAVAKVRAAVEANKPFAVVFLDVRMPPGRDGIWTAEHIRALDPDIQIVIVTAYSDVDPVEISRRVLPADKLLYVQKPFHPQEIRQFASALSAKWQVEKQLQERVIELRNINEQLRQEIAEHKQTEENRLLLSRAVMSSEDGVYVTDMEGKIIFVNKAFCKTYGYDEEEVMGKDSVILWPKKGGGDRMRSVFHILKDTSKVGFYHRRKDGSMLPVSLSRSVVKDGEGNDVAVVGIVHDISEHMEIQRMLTKENLQLREENQLTLASVSTALGEVRAALGSLKGTVSDAESNVLNEISPQLMQKLELVESSIKRATTDGYW